MKRLLVLAFVFLITSCGKCYKCKAKGDIPEDLKQQGYEEVDICKSQFHHNSVWKDQVRRHRKGITFTDGNGQPTIEVDYRCTRKLF